ncbi:MAG: Stp1/IreP family PP2C-type Ser/Thr phosphatase [Verrucomicrobia bacterium]|nr:Stp1/IreP family PP2C-type Ser/Thr phosphatase [Verrucomicrobiota bacterium]
MPFRLESFGISDIGLVRSNNEDVWAAVGEKQFFILADGMGGHKAGEVASSYALQSMCESIRSLKSDSSVEEVCQFLREAIAKANAKVFDEAHRHPDYAGMGTTLSCFVITEEHLVYAHIGDSRLYRFRGKLKQLTEDHSLRNTVWSRDEDSPPALLMRNVITRAIGTQPTILPDIGVIPLRPKDIYMLCSDGLSDYVEEEKIARLLGAPLSLEEMGKKLVDAALEKGGNDNITLLLVKVK